MDEEIPFALVDVGSARAERSLSNGAGEYDATFKARSRDRAAVGPVIAAAAFVRRQDHDGEYYSEAARFVAALGLTQMEPFSRRVGQIQARSSRAGACHHRLTDECFVLGNAFRPQ